jgi:hypothetical protein
MHGPNDNAVPSRTGMRRLIVPWAFRHLGAVAVIRITVGIILTVLGLITLTAGSFTPKAVGFAMVFFAAAVVHLAFTTWVLAIARSSGPAGASGGNGR